MPAFKMYQDEQEIDSLIDVFQREGVRSYLEIGSRNGGSLYRIGVALPEGSRIVSVDREPNASLKDCIEELKCGLGHEARLFIGDSKDDGIVQCVRDLGPYDAVFIDGDHTRAGVFRDWENYSPMGRLIAFHDIAWFRTPSWEGLRVDVPELWNYLRAHYRFCEFRYDPSGKNNGIGVIWREDRAVHR